MAIWVGNSRAVVNGAGLHEALVLTTCMMCIPHSDVFGENMTKSMKSLELFLLVLQIISTNILQTNGCKNMKSHGNLKKIDTFFWMISKGPQQKNDSSLSI